MSGAPSLGPGKARRPKALFVLERRTCGLIYPPAVQETLCGMADFYAEPQTRESVTEYPEVLEDVEVIFSGWGAPRMDWAFLEAAPNLQAVFYGAGTIGYFVTEEFWQRDIVVTSASEINAQPVAEYTLGAILLCLKNFWVLSRAVKTGEGWGDHTRLVPGGFRSRVSLISCGMVARRLIGLLKPFDIECLVYDPFLNEAEAKHLGVRLCSLDEAFREGDVVSLHAPEKPETYGMITGEHFRQMKNGAYFINTARPRIVRQNELTDVLRSRPDLHMILDVAEPEPLPLGSPLLQLPNVIVTPHIAGSLGPECARLGEFMAEEFRRYLAGEPLSGAITRDRAALLA